MGAVSQPARAVSRSASLEAVRAILRRLRSGRGASIGLFLTICLISGTLAIIPRMLTRTTHRGLVAAVDDATRSQPGIRLGLEATLNGQPNDPMSAVADDGQRFQAGLPPTIQNVVTGSSYIVDSQRFTLLNPFGPVKNSAFFQTFLTLRFQSELDRTDRLSFVSGRLPQAIPPVSPSVFKGQAGELGGDPLPAIQIALDETTAQALKVKLGDQLLLQPDLSDSRAFGVPSAYLSYSLVAQVSGIFRPAAPNDRYWLGDNGLLQPTVLTEGDSVRVDGYGLIAPAAYPALLAQTSPINWTYTWRYEIDPKRVNADNDHALDQSIRSLLLTHGAATDLTNDPSNVSLYSPIPTALEQFQAQRAFFLSVVAVASLGVAAVAVLLLILVNLLMVERRASGTTLLRGRGASAGQLLSAHATEALLLALPAAAIGYIAARLIVPLPGLGFDLVLAVATGLLAIGLALLAMLPDARRPLGELLTRQRNPDRSVRETPRHPERRIALEGVVVLLAAVGIYLARRRGLIASGNSVDPYLALVPFLAGLAAGIIVLRLYPLPFRLVNRVVQRGRGIVIWAGLQRVIRQPARSQLPLLALLVAVGVAVFSLVIQQSLSVAQSKAAWATVGADYRIDAPVDGTLPQNWQLQTTAGVQAIAQAYDLQETGVRYGGTNVGGVSLLALDPAAYQTVTAGTPDAIHFPAGFAQQPANDSLGTAANPLPVIVSSDWPGGVKVGQSLQIILKSVPYWIQVRGMMTSFPSLPADAPFVIMSRDALQAARSDKSEPLAITRLYVRGSGSGLTARLQASMRQQAPGATLTSRADALAGSSHQMLSGGVNNAFRYSVLLVALYTAVAGSVALMLTSADRRRDLSYLRTLGLSTRQAFGITVVEQLPPVLTAVIAGAGLGCVIAWLIGPSLNLSAFTGRAGITANIVVNWGQVAALAGGLGLAVFLVMIVFGLLTRHLDLASTLRLGER
jgi:putative ABC transport system permease protein